MSEVKGTLLTIILALAAFTAVFGVVTFAIEQKAKDVANKIDNAGESSAAAPAAANSLVYHY